MATENYELTCVASRLLPARKIVVSIFYFLFIAVPGCRKPHDFTVIASVNGEAIRRSELDRLFKAQRQSFGGSQMERQDQADSSRLNLLNYLIDQTILQQRAARMNLTAKDEDVDTRLLAIREQYSQAEFTQLLLESHQTIDDLRRDVRRYLTLDRLLNKEINSKIRVTDADVEQYFNAHQAQYNLAENRYRIAQIVVMDLRGKSTFVPQAGDPRSDAEARMRIEILRNRLTAGEDFGTVAIRYSEDQSAQNGGDVGFFSESQLRSDPQIYDTVTKLKVGQFSNILHVSPTTLTQPVCYKILKLIARDVAGRRSLDPLVQQEIHDEILNERSQLLQIAYFQTLRDGSNIQNHLAEEIFAQGTSNSVSPGKN
ncbi:peptidyl-prolyl cis-trans isomerase SurA [Edaphobacter aggregans]|uniref:Peptidyl-prolyl cis-trans isomerase SurA n=1 Tax=Edaphobacter aggregans TaxID=570835 RepID=A0A3R9Q8T8_9BACT|nr:SurA N-terminal domain-containing protein [Edaphobacter aggregans]RSL16010.1 peptidyl-prolyl cis-trans isomerase SurA [Edaphobacter aggregans]